MKRRGRRRARNVARGIAEILSSRLEYSVSAILDGKAETDPGPSASDGYLDGFVWPSRSYESSEPPDFVAPDPDFEPQYEWWRHGGWLVLGLRHKDGTVGCVSRNYPDRKWRIVNDPRQGDHTYESRDEAARVEYALTGSRGETSCVNPPRV